MKRALAVWLWLGLVLRPALAQPQEPTLQPALGPYAGEGLPVLLDYRPADGSQQCFVETRTERGWNAILETDQKIRGQARLTRPDARVPFEILHPFSPASKSPISLGQPSWAPGLRKWEQTSVRVCERAPLLVVAERPQDFQILEQKADRRLNFLPPERLPRIWQGYLSCGGVVITTACLDRVPPAATQALKAWAKMSGLLTIVESPGHPVGKDPTWARRSLPYSQRETIHPSEYSPSLYSTERPGKSQSVSSGPGQVATLLWVGGLFLAVLVARRARREGSLVGGVIVLGPLLVLQRVQPPAWRATEIHWVRGQRVSTNIWVAGVPRTALRVRHAPQAWLFYRNPGRLIEGRGGTFLSPRQIDARPNGFEVSGPTTDEDGEAWMCIEQPLNLPSPTRAKLVGHRLHYENPFSQPLRHCRVMARPAGQEGWTSRVFELPAGQGQVELQKTVKDDEDFMPDQQPGALPDEFVHSDDTCGWGWLERPYGFLPPEILEPLVPVQRQLTLVDLQFPEETRH